MTISVGAAARALMARLLRAAAPRARRVRDIVGSSRFGSPEKEDFSLQRKSVAKVKIDFV